MKLFDQGIGRLLKEDPSPGHDRPPERAGLEPPAPHANTAAKQGNIEGETRGAEATERLPSFRDEISEPAGSFERSSGATRAASNPRINGPDEDTARGSSVVGSLSDAADAETGRQIVGRQEMIENRPNANENDSESRDSAEIPRNRLKTGELSAQRLADGKW